MYVPIVEKVYLLGGEDGMPSLSVCFNLRDGMVLLVAIHLFSSVFWTASIALETQPEPTLTRGLHLASIVFLAVNACLGLGALRGESEGCAALQIVTFGAQLILFCADVAVDHPVDCDAESINSSDSPLGEIRNHDKSTPQLVSDSLRV